MFDFLHIVEQDGIALFTLILAFIGLGSTLFFFRSGLLFVLQLVIFGGFVYFANMTGLVILVGLVELLFTLYTLYRMHLAIEYNYQLVLEKTHLVRPKITRQSYTGGKGTF